MADSRRREAAEPEADPKPEVGARLRAAREAQQLSMDDVSAELRIGVEALAALEDERFDALGAPVFARGYLKQYGARLGLDASELLADYDRLAGRAQILVRPSKSIRLRDDRQVTFWIVAGVVLVLVVVLLSLWWLKRPGALIG